MKGEYISIETLKIIFSVYDNPAFDYFYTTEIDSTLYDLIKADMIEKIEE